MSDELTSNVYVDGQWFGPDYPKAGEPPAGSVTNPAAFADLDEAGQPVQDEDGNYLSDGKPVQVDSSASGAHASERKSSSSEQSSTESRTKR